MAESETTTEQNTKKSGNGKWVALIIVALLIGGALGYVLGGNMKESEIQDAYNQQIDELEEQLDTAKNEAGDTLEAGQDAVAEGQQTLESLQAENATLKTTIEEQTTKIADLERQLEDAQNETNGTN